MTTRPWPEDDRPADFEDIVEPLYALHDLIMDSSAARPLTSSYAGYDIGEDTAAHSLRAEDLFQQADIDPFHALIRLAVQVGIEQGRRITVSGPYMPATDVVSALTSYLESMDMTVAPETLMGLLKSAAKNLLSADGEPFQPAIMPENIQPTIVTEVANEPAAPDPQVVVVESLPAHDETMMERAKRRPANFAALSAQEQWMVDKELGILDWDGSPC